MSFWPTVPFKLLFKEKNLKNNRKYNLRHLSKFWQNSGIDWQVLKGNSK